MSYTTLYAAYESPDMVQAKNFSNNGIYKPGDLISIAEFRNSWGSAVFVWDVLCNKYRHSIEKLLDVHFDSLPFSGENRVIINYLHG